ncbi:MAG: S9 family peptidase [Piscinibacter sp.]|uniref:S9 family peptidase n=1 Tax=Piscinibacter sp. TaxID=1903157 RepID=UPI001B5B178B|nr:prolyl oligopeptidase family serine peptidase [Piscinibacter sp.]MBP5992269.1 S9 family peptidase [Piscinibacter sp.]MBP6029640.1 S9 family peptidase [Piscinibacter sp.]
MLRLALLLPLLLAACAAPNPDADAPRSAAAAEPPAVVAPNANLVAQGIPPIPAALVAEVARYTDFRGHNFVEWHPQRRELLVSHRKAGASTLQLFRVAAPLAEPEALTDAAEPVRRATWEPRRGDYLVFARGNGGDEADQLYRLDLATRNVTLLTDPSRRHGFETWLNRSSQLLTSSVPLDRSTQGSAREQPRQTFTLIDPAEPTRQRRVGELPGAGWDVGGISADDRQAVLTRYLSANESQVWLLDLASGRSTQLLPAPGSKDKGVYFAAGFERGDRALWVLSDRGGEFRQIYRYELRRKTLQPVSAHIPWDVDQLAVAKDGKLLAARINVDGREELRLFDARTLKERPAPALPAGSVRAIGLHPASGEIAVAMDGASGPSTVLTLDAAGRGAIAWTRAGAAPGVDTQAFADASIVRWKSFDGRSISGLLHLPPQRFTGPRPVLIDIHGGPEAQARVGFMGRDNHFLQDLGIAIVQPNVRGSSGYGKTFLALDNGTKREDAVKDIGALLDWIATQPRLDASRVVVRGGSYGGYMSLAVAATYPERIAGAIDVVGISNFVTFLRNTESYRRDLRRVEYGDERDEAMRSFLERISPTSHAARIVKPLFVVQGRNDPRVPYTEAEQIVEKVRANGTPVWYLRAENEGHGFQRKENADFQFWATTLFLRQTLLR